MYGSLEETDDDFNCDTSGDEQIQITDRSERSNIIKSNVILKFFVSCFYGILPQFHQSRHYKEIYFIPAAILAVFQWLALAEYSYVVTNYWKNSTYQNLTSETKCKYYHCKCFKDLPPEMLVIRTETVILLMGLLISGAITVTLGTMYFRRNFRAMPFTNRRRLRLLPQVSGNLCDGDELNDLRSKDWIQVNALLAAGIIIVIFSIFTDQFFNTYFDFVGIHNFLKNKHLPAGQKVMYFLALSMLFWGYGATICACCLFHAMALRINSQIDNTELVVLANVHSREGFFVHTNNLIRYKTEMISMFKLWFASHNIVFILLLAGVIYEWIEVLQVTENTIPQSCFLNLMASQLAGTLAIVYKFAFPIISASLVTNRFNKYFKNIAFSNKIKDMNVTEILILTEQTGFEVFFIRVTPKLAVLLCVSCFIGVLKVVTQIG